MKRYTVTKTNGAHVNPPDSAFNDMRDFSSFERAYQYSCALDRGQPDNGWAFHTRIRDNKTGEGVQIIEIEDSDFKDFDFTRVPASAIAATRRFGFRVTYIMPSEIADRALI